MGFDPDIPDDAPDEFQAFEDLDEMDNYAEELEGLIEHLAEESVSGEDSVDEDEVLETAVATSWVLE